ncbi:MurR/RpiR family transcriptional regulator [Yersinia enterocolitica]
MKQIDERLRAHYAQLTPQEQRVTDFIFGHFDDLISYNSAELARLSGVSKATVSRLFKRLGYSSYREMREEVRTLRQSGMPLTDNRDAVQGNTLLARHSYPIALHLRQQLLQVRQSVQLIPQAGQTLSEELVDAGPRDVVVVVAFRRRPKVIREILLQMQVQGVPTLLICEPQAQSLLSLAHWRLTTPLDSVSAFDSYSSAMSLANLLSNALLHEMLTQGRQRIHQIADLYDAFGELEQR